LPAARARQRDPRRIDIALNLAKVHLGRRNFQAAAGLLEEVVNSQADAAGAWLLLGLARLRLGRPERALAAAERAAQLQPALARAHFLRGVCLDALGRGKEARRAVRRALELDPRLEEAQRFLKKRR